ncbi:MAG: tripartite tricarboxylate transporter family receptor [Hyphomicrobiales bacterium]|nr:tripartite tricarboxylate transporter family receptor [Hyphomicrobiales bacterium]
MIVRFTVALVAAFASLCAAQAQTPDAKPRDIRLLISHPPGGGYDTYARLLARHIGKQVPGGANIISQNMPGAAGVLMTNYMASQAPKDGSMIGLGPGSVATAALFNNAGARYDARTFSWIGSMNSEVGVAVSWKTSPVKTAQDLFSHELIVAAAGKTDNSVVFPSALNSILGTRFKIISGYGGSSETTLALERGEAAGIGGWNYSSIVATRPDWLKDGSINLLAQFALARHPDLPNTPTAVELGRTDQEREVLRLVFAQSSMGRVVFGPPGLADDAAKMWKDAFRATIADAEFLADARHARIEINQPMDGEAVSRLVEDLHNANAAQIKRAAEAAGGAG